METIIEIIITALAIIGLHNSMYYEIDENGNIIEKNVLWFVKFYAIKYLGEFWSKPIATCPRCMASFYGCIFYFVVFDNGVHDALFFIPFVACVSGLISIFNNSIL